MCSTLFFLQPLLFFNFILHKSTFSRFIQHFYWAAHPCVPHPFACLFFFLFLLLFLHFKLRLLPFVFIWTVFTSLFFHIYIPLQFTSCLLLVFTWISAHFFFLCVSSSIAFYLLTSFEFLDLRLLSQKCLEFRLLRKGTGFSYTVLSFFILQGPGFCNVARYASIEKCGQIECVGQNRIREEDGCVCV